MTPSDRSEAIRRAQDGALKAANEGRWDHARAFLEYREEILKMDQSHLSAADSSAASGSSVPAPPTLPAGTVVKVNGFPFALTNDTPVGGLASNLELAQGRPTSLSEEARDAARYRWLRGHAGEIRAANNLVWEADSDIFDNERDSKRLDDAIDAAMGEPQ